MSDLHSPSWYRVAHLRPQLRSHARIHRHQYRGELWYVLEDKLSRRVHRFNPIAYYVIGLLDGRRTVQQIWENASTRFGDDAPTQDEVIRLLGQLHAAEVLQTEAMPDVAELLRRAKRTKKKTWLQNLLSPMAMRFPLVDPDRALERWLPWYRPWFGWAGAIVWLIVVAIGAVNAVSHWNELTEDVTSRVLAPENLLLLWLTFPLLKLAHELGHACAVKAWGGEVHEMGVMFLVLVPVPYVDASAASAFPEKRHRVVVGAGGMIVEVFIASLAFALWLEIQPGILRAVLFNVMLIAGVSTVLFNANPLLRFDGYYIASDLLEIPNLRQRAQQYFSSLLESRLFGTSAPTSDAGLRERTWLVFFAVASFLYRMTITVSIAAFIATQYFFLGVLLAIWALVTGFLLPVGMLLNYLAFSPRLRRYRVRALATSGAAAALLLILVFLVPLPSWTNAQGVIWDAEQSSVRGATDGFVKRVVAAPGALVHRGDPLIEAEDPLLGSRIRMLEARRSEFEARYYAERVDSLVRAQMTLESMKSAEAELRRAQEKAAGLVLRSPSNGVFVLPSPDDLPGRYLRQGELVGYVIPEGGAAARVVVPQQSVDLVRARTERVTVKLAERLAETYPARIVREVPRASDQVPSLALSQAGGGEIALDPGTGGRGQPKTLQTHFEFEIQLLSARPIGAGGRVSVRFDHQRETIAEQGWRLLRQLFLRRFAT